MTGLSLFRLPILSMENVFSMMTPYDLLVLSLMSLKTRKAVKRFSRTKAKFQIVFEITAKPCLSFVGKKESWYYCWTSNRIEVGYLERTFPLRVFYRVTKYSENPIEEFKKAYNYIKKVLRCEIVSIHYQLKLLHSENRPIIDWFRSTQESVNNLHIQGSDGEHDDDVKYILSNLKVTERLFIMEPWLKEDLEMEIPEGLQHLQITGSYFIKLEQFLRFNYPEIVLRRLFLTNREINIFLRSWMACESHLNLKRLEITVPHPPVINEIMNLPHVETRDPNLIDLLRRQFSTDRTNCFILTRSDGKIAIAGVTSLLQYFDFWRLCMLTY
uniref:F-box domain-containing protein n=2 Tax=Caenorhabditis tropicalis TaxID=1561998 RepID=A0A1I7TJK4_9PELO